MDESAFASAGHAEDMTTMSYHSFATSLPNDDYHCRLVAVGLLLDTVHRLG